MKKSFKLVSLAVCLVLVLSLAFTLVACDKGTEKQYEYFENDILFSISNDGEVVGLTFALFSSVFDQDESYFTFTSSGKVHGQLKTKTNIVDMLGGLLRVFKVDINEITSGLSNIDLDEAIVKPYVLDMFPGFTLDDLKDSFDLMKKSLGLSLIGIDFEHPIVKEIEETHRIPSDLVSRLPEDFSFGIAFDNEYFLKDVVDADGNTHKAIYVGDIVAKNENTQPFIIFEVSEKKGKKQLKLDVKFIMVSLVLEEAL
ncbi:MAG: hypothetical protein IJ226_03045 [Clostridia bacterium]|nr:hypothetical protein [Clostridia bacterium]